MQTGALAMWDWDSLQYGSQNTELFSPDNQPPCNIGQRCPVTEKLPSSPPEHGAPEFVHKNTVGVSRVSLPLLFEVFRLGRAWGKWHLGRRPRIWTGKPHRGSPGCCPTQQLAELESPKGSGQIQPSSGTTSSPKVRRRQRVFPGPSNYAGN